MGDLYQTKPEETACRGCMQSDPPQELYLYCSMCEIRDCVRGKGFYSCHQCDRWPCAMIENFGLATGRRVMQRTIPIWRAKSRRMGDEKARRMGPLGAERYHCPFCGKRSFGTKRGRACKADVAELLDGML